HIGQHASRSIGERHFPPIELLELELQRDVLRDAQMGGSRVGERIDLDRPEVGPARVGKRYAGMSQTHLASMTGVGRARAAPPRPLQIRLVPYLSRLRSYESTNKRTKTHFIKSARVLPRRAGEGETAMPASSMAAIFDSASPLPPEMMAPAWP